MAEDEVALSLEQGDIAIAFDDGPGAPAVSVEPQLDLDGSDTDSNPPPGYAMPPTEEAPGAGEPGAEEPQAEEGGPGAEQPGIQIKIDHAPRSSGLADVADVAGFGAAGDEEKKDAMALDLGSLPKAEIISKTHSVPVTMGGAVQQEKRLSKMKPAIPVVEEEEVKTPGKRQPFMKRTVSLDTGMNEEKKKEEGMSDDEVFSVRQASMLTMIASTKKGGKFMRGKSEESEQQIVVPPRDVLLRMPMYSTPLTLEATNNAYRDFVSRLMGMGFEIGQAEVAVIMTNAESVEHGVEYILQHPDACWHRFKPNEDTLGKLSARPQKQRSDGRLLAEFEKEDLCDECGMPYWRHNVDPHGDKIEQVVDEEEIQLHGDLEGRVSMSMATRQEQEALKESLQDMIANRLKSLQEEEPSMEAEPLQEAPRMPEEEPIDPNYDGPMDTCQICFDEKPTHYFFAAPCGHNYCNFCLQEHYRVKVNDADVLKLGCIDVNCDREITDEEIRRFLKDPELLQKYEKFRTNKLIQLNPNARFCPKPNCDGHMIGSRWKPKISCPDCGMEICFNCTQEWHGYFVGCNTQVDLGFSKWALNKDVQKCPKCKIRIEKNEGCNHMTCRSCRYEFCWICRGPYNGSHFEWWNIFGCPGAQYTPRFCRCPAFFPRWLNRVLILVCFLLVVLPLAVVAGALWMVLICFMFCLRCKTDNMNPCDCF